MKSEIIERKEKVLSFIQDTEDEKLINFMYGICLGQLERASRKTLIELRGNRSKEEVAKALDISVTSLTAYENGERVPRDEVKVRLSKFYGVPNYYGKIIKNAAPTDQSKSCI